MWIPISGVGEGFAALDKSGKPYVPTEPTAIEKLYMIAGTLDINKRPGPSLFEISYKPGTIVSDGLRKLEYEFGQQKIGSKPTKAEVQGMLKEQLAKADEQKSELVVAPNSEGFAWLSLVRWGLGAAVAVALIGLWVQRRRH